MSATIATIPADAYHCDDLASVPSLSCSIAKKLCYQSPAHAWAAHPKLNPAFERTEEKKFDVGNAVHRILLEGEDNAHIVSALDWRSKAAKEEREYARREGKTPLLIQQWEEVVRMVAAVQDQIAGLEADPPMFVDGKPEQTIVWEEPNGAVCRARLDWLHDSQRAIDDLKTTGGSADPEAWTRTMFGSGFDIQAAFYLRGLRALTGLDAEFRFLVAETSEPFAVSVVSLAPSALELAASKVEYAIDRWQRCLEEDRWPGYDPRVAYVDAPSWEQVRWLDKQEMAA